MALIPTNAKFRNFCRIWIFISSVGHNGTLDEPRLDFYRRGTTRWICVLHGCLHIFVASLFFSANFILEVSLISFQFELWIIYLDLISRFFTSKTPSKFQFENFRIFRNFRRSHDGSRDKFFVTDYAN